LNGITKESTVVEGFNVSWV